MALRNLLRLQVTDLYREGMFKLKPRLKKMHHSAGRSRGKNNDSSLEQMSHI
jgi:hypothetical protein